MKKAKYGIAFLLVAALLTISVFADIPLGQATDTAYGYTMTSKVTKTTSSSTMSGSGDDLFISLSCIIWYTDNTYTSGNASCRYPDESVPVARATLNSLKVFDVTYGMNSFQPYDDDSLATHGTFLEYTE